MLTSFHIRKIIIHHLDGLFEPNWYRYRRGNGINWYRYRRGNGLKSHTGLNFFQVLFSTTRFSSALSYEDLLISFLHRSAIYEFHISKIIMQ